MPALHCFPLAAALGIALLASCSVDSPAADITSGAEPWIAKGRVTDSAGRPMDGVQVRASHTMFHNAHLYAVTDRDGRYRIELSDLAPSSWQVGGTVEREFGGVRYLLDLHVDSHAGFPGREGAVRDLEWRLGGEDGNGGWHGAVASVWQVGEGRVDGRELVLELEPLELIDGSQGDVMSRRVDGDVVRGIPIGRHRVSVYHAPEDGPRRRFRLRDGARDDAPYAESVELSVRQDRYGFPVLPIEVEVPADAAGSDPVASARWP